MDSKANIIYPAYINNNRTVARGRRIPLRFAVPDPKPNEVVDALYSLKGIQAQAEAKPYCRELDKESVPWRIRYSNLNPAKNSLKNKREILVACAKRINEVRLVGGGGGGGNAKSESGKQNKNKGGQSKKN